MEITIEISYYPFLSHYNLPVKELLEMLIQDKQVVVEPGMMSTMISGEYDYLMFLLKDKMKIFLEKYPAVFVLKISNACGSCKKSSRI